MADLDAKTVKAFHEAKPRTIYLDHALDRAASRELTRAERSARMGEIAHFLLDRRSRRRREDRGVCGF